MDILDIATRLMVFFVPFLFSLCFHEYAHGWVAKLRGDRTAEMMGRLTMNPLVHLDPIGTVLLPVLSVLFMPSMMFGWAKPVPVNSRNLKNPRTDMFWVALAGPASNILLGVIGVFILAAVALFFRTATFFEGIVSLLKTFIGVNLFLAFFNLIPLNPLDGGKVIARFLPASWNLKLEQNEQWTGLFLLILFLTGGIQFLVIPVQWTYQHLINFALGVLG
jgi:Zn-dependent protease